MAYARAALGASGALVTHEGSVLLMRRAYSPEDWVMPGGNAEPGESPVATLRREVREEVGLNLDPLRLTGVYRQSDHPAGEFLHFVFLVPIPADAPVRPEPREVAEWGLFSPDELPGPMSASTRIRLLEAVWPRPEFLPTDLLAGSDG